jgi:hypothetical protein
VAKCPDTGKWCYESRSEARAAAKALRVLLKDSDLTHYRCEHCGDHHVGHAFGMTRDEHRQIHAEKNTEETRTR